MSNPAATVLGTRSKASDESLDYRVDWSLWLADGDFLTDATFSVATPPDNALSVYHTTFDSHSSIFWVTGGTAGSTYTIICQVTTGSTPPRVGERLVKIAIKS